MNRIFCSAGPTAASPSWGRAGGRVLVQVRRDKLAAEGKTLGEPEAADIRAR